MKRNRVLSAGLGLVIAFGAMSGLAACSSDDGGSSDTATVATADVDVATDLQNAAKAVATALAEDDSWDKIMLASDVKVPTVKYGLLVVPFTPSDAASRVQGTIAIADGKYTIEADSKATGKTWQINEAGVITEVTK